MEEKFNQNKIEESLNISELENQLFTERDDILAMLLKNCPKKNVVEKTFLSELKDNNEYLDLCKNYIGDIYLYASFNNIKNCWFSIDNLNMDSFLQIVNSTKKDEVLYFLPNDLGIIELYVFDNMKTIKQLRKKSKYYDKIIEISNSKTKNNEPLNDK